MKETRKLLVALDEDRRTSGNGGFEGIKRTDIGRIVVVDRYTTWGGILGHFKDDEDEIPHVFFLDELSETAELPKKKYQVIYADPPWDYK